MKRLLLLTALLLPACESPGKFDLAPTTRPSIQTLRNDVYWLADDAREGRLPGTPGADAAADYIARRFDDLGLEAAPEIGSYRQTFDLPGKATLGKNNALLINQQDALRLDHDYRPLAFSPTGSFEGKVAFAGYGVSSKKYDYDDYANLDIAGRAVVAMRYEPHNNEGKSRFTGGEFSENAPITKKAQEARSRGATALLLVNPPENHPHDAPLRPFVSLGSRFEVAAIPVISITPDVARKLLGGRDLLELQRAIDRSGKPNSFLVDANTATGTVDLEVQRTIASNVVGVLPGSGPQRDEYVVVGAHYDHIGRGGFGSRKPGQNLIHNGADDNASGTAAMMAVAEQLAGGRLNRSVLFVGFSGEESGLLGSRHFVTHPPVPMEKVVAMLNLDMVGRLRNNALSIGGGGTRAAFKPLLEKLDERSPLEFRNIGLGGFGPSDHQSFAMKKVPVLFFFTGLHGEYHHPDDDAPLVNYDGLAEISHIVASAVAELASLPREPYVDRYDGSGMNTGITTPETPDGASTQPATQSSRMGRASLGVIPDYGSDQSTGGVRIGGAVPNSPAAGAGLIEGDVLTGWNDKPIGNLYDLTDLLRKSEPGEEITIHYTRAGKPASARVRLAERKGMN